MNITELNTFSPTQLDELNSLMHELSSHSDCTEALLDTAIKDENAHIYVILDDEHIIGSACLCIANTTEHTLGFIEAVVVSGNYRGQHLGRRLMEHVIRESKRLHIDTLHMTSNPRRIAANCLYQSLGFELYETNVYKMKLCH